jgi:hypothetical protein
MPSHPCRPLLLPPLRPRCINTYDCTYFTRTPKGRCWLKKALGWSVRSQNDPCPGTVCTEGTPIDTLPPAEDEAGPVPAASPASGSGRRLRGKPTTCSVCQDAPSTPTAPPADDEDPASTTGSSGSGSNTDDNILVPNTPTEPAPVAAGEEDPEEDPAAPPACARWVSGNVRNDELPGHDATCTIGALGRR